MITIISPAKTQDFNSPAPKILATSPVFFNKIQDILQICKNLPKDQIKQLMGISDKLTELNYHRFQNFTTQPSKSAIFAYDGDVYDNLNRQNFTKQQLDFLQTHSLIISGLYGLLRPFDEIQAYRLEMSINLPNIGKLVNFWQSDITNYLNKILASHSNQYLLNLASNEYSSSVAKSELKYPIINIHFKELKNNKLQIVAINAKKARGSMLNFITTNFIDIPKKLQDFSQLGYQFSLDLSSDSDWIFIKK
jgi:hypothetical protein